MNVDDVLEDIRWIRSLGGEKLPAASNALLHSSAQMCLYQTPGRRPPPITGLFVNTVTRGWVGAPNGRAPFRFHGAVIVFVDRCLSRTRNLAASNKHLAGFLRPILAQDRPRNFFFGVFEKFEAFFSKICAHSERYRNLLAGIFEILTFNGNIAFPLSPVSPVDARFKYTVEMRRCSSIASMKQIQYWYVFGGGDI